MPRCDLDLGNRSNPFGVAIRSTQLPMVITDPHQPDNPIVFINDAFAALTGYSHDEIVGRNCRFLQGPDTDALAVQKIKSAVANGSEVQVDILNYRKDGSAFWNALYLSPARDDNHKVCFYFASLIDISERVAAHRTIEAQKTQIEAELVLRLSLLEELERTKASAERAARLKAEFVANMSHELRTPLTGILGFHDLLQADSTLGAKQRRYLVMARNAGRALLAIVNDVLDFSKIEAGELTIESAPFSPLAVVEACEDLVLEAARAKALHLDVQFASVPPMLTGDVARIKQILLNLLTNAIKFTDKGSVTLSIGYDPDTSRLRFAVTDTGIGIANEQLSSLFVRFSQADTSITRRFGGTGLGLAICKKLSELMGGEIGVTSQLGQGSTFWLEIPAEAYSPDTAEPASQKAVKIVSRQILLAEDNLVNQEVIKAILETRGNVVTLVDNGAAAAAAALTNPGFQIILMDLQMPIMDGLAASRAIRAAEKAEVRPNVPIIALSANAMVEDVELCLGAGMNAHVAKPVEWTDLFDAMDKVTSQSSVTAAVSLSDLKCEIIESLDRTKLEHLAANIGVERVLSMLKKFALEVEGRLEGLDEVTERELATRAHVIVSIAGQFGFTELSRLCATIEGEAQLGYGKQRLPELRSTAERALTTARNFEFNEAA